MAITTERRADQRPVPHIPTAEGDRRLAADLLATWSQEDDRVLARADVIDRLLDLRSLVRGPDRLAIDLVLIDVPGRTLVDRSWWSARLDEVGWFLGFTDRRPESIRPAARIPDPAH